MVLTGGEVIRSDFRCLDRARITTVVAHYPFWKIKSGISLTYRRIAQCPTILKFMIGPGTVFSNYSKNIYDLAWGLTSNMVSSPLELAALDEEPTQGYSTKEGTAIIFR